MPNTLKVVPIPLSALVVLIGVAGSGKSTFANARFLPTEILSSDHFRGLVCDDESNQQASEDAFAVLHLLADIRLRRGHLSVVDATNVKPEYRAPLLEAARRHNRPAIALVFELPEEVCVSRAQARTARPVNADVIREQAQALAAQTDEKLLKEGFSAVYRLGPDGLVEIDRAIPVPAEDEVNSKC